MIGPELVNSFGALRRFVRRPSAVETCELCGAGLALQHQHLIDPLTRKLHCACGACAILFSNQSRTKYKLVPRSIRFVADFRLTDSQWNGLMMPINMAFFFKSSPQNRVVAMYPSPAGATESLLTFDTWGEIELDNPILGKMEPDVEALLVNRVGHARGFANPEYYIVPIDECFKLVGLIRSHWQGLSGGAEVWREVAGFFGELKDKSPRAEMSHA